MRAQAIEFVQMQRDDELWELLISLAIGSADLTGGPNLLTLPQPLSQPLFVRELVSVP